MTDMGNFSKKLKKIFFWKPSVRLTAVFALLALALLLVPLVRISFYAVPWYDDYNYGSFAKAWMEMTDSPWGALKGALSCVKTQWYAWQGTYSSIFFMALMPGIWGEDKYFLGPLFLFALLLTGIFVLVKVLVMDVAGGDGASCVVLQSVTAAVVIVLIYSSQAGFFWYNAGIHYVGMHAFCLLFTACVIKLLLVSGRLKRIALVILSMLLALLVAGSNYVTALQGGLLLLSVGAAGIFWYKKPKRALLLLPAVCVYVVGFYKNAAAPGNQVRARSYVGWGLSPLSAVWHSFLEAFGHMWEFTGFITLAVMVLLLPVIWQMVKKCRISFHLPGLVAVWSLCLYATGFTSSLYSLGHAGLSRTLNAVKITWQLLLILNEVYFLGWLSGCLEKRKKGFGSLPCWWFYPILGAVMLAIFSVSPNQAGNYSSFGAYYYVHTGEAYNFYQEYLKRVEILKSSEPDVVLSPYHYRPWLLCMGDLSDDPDNEANRAVANWYGKSSVVVKDTKGASAWNRMLP